MRAAAAFALALAGCSPTPLDWAAWIGPCTANADCVISTTLCPDADAGMEVAVLRSREQAMREAVCPSCVWLTCPTGGIAWCAYDPHAVAICTSGRCAAFVTRDGGAGQDLSRCDADADCVAHVHCGTAGVLTCGEPAWAPIRRDAVARYEASAGCVGVDEHEPVRCVSHQCELVSFP